MRPTLYLVAAALVAVGCTAARATGDALPDSSFIRGYRAGFRAATRPAHAPAPPASTVVLGPESMPESWATVALVGPTVTYHGELPTLGTNNCGADSSYALHSWMRMELWFQKQAPSPWWPPFWPKYAPKFIAASRDSSPGAVVSIALPDTFSTGTLIAFPRGPAGLGCSPSNMISSWNHP